jgi:glycerate kinase
LDDQDEQLRTPKTLSRLKNIDIQNIDKRITDCEFIVLCDVDNKLLGAKGAAAVFGPQKGAGTEAVRVLDKGLEQFCKVTSALLSKDMAAIKYGGAAGGASAGVWAWLNAKLVNGIEYFLDLTSFDHSLEKSQLVITGEGSIDEQTLQGKGPFGVANRAKGKHIPVIGLAGKIPLEINDGLKKYFDILIAIGNEPTDLKAALSQTEQNLQRVSCEIGNAIRAGIHISK